jgi:hypothetical protein
MITRALDVDTMEIDSVPEPIIFVTLIQAVVNEGFARIAFLQAKKEYRKRAKGTCNPYRQTSRSVSPMPSSIRFREYTVDSAVVDRVAT